MLCLLKHTELLTSVWIRLDYALILDFVVIVVVVVSVVVIVIVSHRCHLHRSSTHSV